MIRNIAAAIVGALIAIALVQLIETLSHIVYPPPADLEFGNPEQVRTYMAGLPAGAILMVGTAWFVGAFGGTVTAALIGTARPLIHAFTVGSIVLAGAITMLIIIPHPWWFRISAPPAVILAAWTGMRIVPLLRGNGADRK